MDELTKIGIILGMPDTHSQQIIKRIKKLVEIQGKYNHNVIELDRLRMALGLRNRSASISEMITEIENLKANLAVSEDPYD